MLSFKSGAKIEGIRPEILLGLLVVERIFSSHGVDTIITEGTGGTHMQGSLHYQGLALDLRSKHISASDTKLDLQAQVRIALNNEFDFFLEGSGTNSEHFHLECDFK